MGLDRRSFELMVRGRDLPWLLRQWAGRTPDKTFLVWAPHDGEHRSWSYAAFEADVRRAAGGLAARGVVLGDRVFLHMDNRPELLIAYFACAALGAVAVVSNTRAGPDELAHYMALTRPVGVLTQTSHLELVEGVRPHGAFLIAADAATRSGDAFADLLAAAPFTNDRPRDPLADLRVQFTSGTTSRPKAVLSTHANTLFAAQQTAYAYALRPDDVCQVFVPLFHNNGLSTMVMSTLWSGGAVVLQPKFSVSNFWGPALAYKATWTSTPGAFFLNALAQSDTPDHGFRFWLAAVLPELEARFGVHLRGHWGMSEMIALPLVGDPFHEGGRLNIGRPAPGTEIAIRRPDGTDCEAGEAGHLYVRGVRGITIFKEYLGDPEATAASFDADGWFDTGDSVRLGPDGDIVFSSRIKDMLRVGGENVAALEIETVIMDTGWALECAVVGKPHPMLEEAPVGFVIPSADAPDDLAEALIAHCAARLADYKTPREIHVVADLPRSTLNKIAKQKLRERLIEEAGAEA